MTGLTGGTRDQNPNQNLSLLWALVFNSSRVVAFGFRSRGYDSLFFTVEFRNSKPTENQA